MISILRSYHVIPSRKHKVPSLDIQFGNERAKLEIDPKNNCCYIGLSEDTVDQLRTGNVTQFFSPCIDIEKLKNDYATSRFLVKVFVEMVLYYSLEYYKEDNKFFKLDEKMEELVQYVRVGNKERSLYNYFISEKRTVAPFSSDDRIATVKLDCDQNNNLIGMTLNLYELEFVLRI